MANMQSAREMGSSRFPDGLRILHGTKEYITYKEQSSIRVWASEVEAHFGMHSHSAIEIIMPYQGEAVYVLHNADEYHIGPGEILIIPSGCAHELTEQGDVQRHLLLFEPNPLVNLRDMHKINSMMQKPIYLRSPSALWEQTRELITQVVACYERQEPLWNTQCYSYLLQMYALLGRDYLQATVPSPYVQGRNIDSAIMNSAITYINEHYMDDISLEDVALFAGFSKYYFSRMFKQFSSMSFSEYLMRKRMNVAIDLLVRTNEPVKEIVRMSGFGSVATFNRIFRERKNCTPSQYRSIYGEMPEELS